MAEPPGKAGAGDAALALPEPGSGPRWMRRPRAGLVSRPSGDAGLRPGALQTPRQELADAEPPRFAQDTDPAATRKGSRSVPTAKRSGETQSADPASKENAANGAPRGARAVQKAARITQDWCASRRSIPLELSRARNLPRQSGDGRRPARGLKQYGRRSVG